MPLVTVRALEGALSPDQREDLLRRITESVVAVQGEGVRPVTWVIFDEIRDRSIAIGGDVISTSHVRELMGARAAASRPTAATQCASAGASHAGGSTERCLRTEPAGT